jgi:hypothetical protein
MLRAIVLERMLGLFVIAQLVHIARWQWCLPAQYLFWFLRVWVVLPTIFILLWIGGWSIEDGGIDWDNALAWFGAWIGYGALCGAYLMIYPAITDLSPSLEILRQLRSAPRQALPVGDLKINTVGGVHGVVHRLVNLQSSGLITASDGMLRVTPPGARIAAVLNAYRAILGIERGTGG